MNSNIGIVATGSFLPETVIGNDEIGRTAGVTAEWIERKTGIRARRRARPDHATSDLAAEAARQALTQAGLPPERITHVIVATSTPDHPQPATACIVAHRIGAMNACAFDINAVCSGFVYALTVAQRMLAGEPHGAHALVIGADIYSRILDYSDRKTAILFGDGAGAVVLGPVPAGTGTFATALSTRGDQHELIRVAAGGSRQPASPATLATGDHFFRMDGRGVRAFVEQNLPAAVDGLLAKVGTARDDIRHFVPHQANGVMIESVWPHLRLPSAALHLEVAEYGNTGAASIPITLDLVHRRGHLATGDMVVLSGFGGGMSIGSALMGWAPTAVTRTGPAAEERYRRLALAG